MQIYSLPLKCVPQFFNSEESYLCPPPQIGLHTAYIYKYTAQELPDPLRFPTDYVTHSLWSIFLLNQHRTLFLIVFSLIEFLWIIISTPSLITLNLFIIVFTLKTEMYCNIPTYLSHYLKHSVLTL